MSGIYEVSPEMLEAITSAALESMKGDDSTGLPEFGGVEFDRALEGIQRQPQLAWPPDGSEGRRGQFVASAATPLKGISCVLAGAVWPAKGGSKANAVKRLQTLGATVVEALPTDASSSVVISSRESTSRPSVILSRAVSRGIPVVGWNWIAACSAAGTVAETEPYVLLQASAKVTKMIADKTPKTVPGAQRPRGISPRPSRASVAEKSVEKRLPQEAKQRELSPRPQQTPASPRSQTASPLDGCSIVLVGDFIQEVGSRKSAADTITRLGGRPVERLAVDSEGILLQVVVTNESALARGHMAISQAIDRGIPVVSWIWVKHCGSLKIRLDPNKYSLLTKVDMRRRRSISPRSRVSGVSSQFDEIDAILSASDKWTKFVNGSHRRQSMGGATPSVTPAAPPPPPQSTVSNVQSGRSSLVAPQSRRPVNRMPSPRPTFNRPSLPSKQPAAVESRSRSAAPQKRQLAMKPLDGIVVLLIGDFRPSVASRPAAVAIIEKAGGSVRDKLTPGCEALNVVVVTTERSLLCGHPQLTAASQAGLSIVSWDWVAESIHQGTLMRTAPYRLAIPEDGDDEPKDVRSQSLAPPLPSSLTSPQALDRSLKSPTTSPANKPLVGFTVVPLGSFRDDPSCPSRKLALGRIVSSGAETRETIGGPSGKLVVVSTRGGVTDASTALRQAVSRRLPIVKLEWVTACIKMKRIVPYDEYLLVSEALASIQQADDEAARQVVHNDAAIEGPEESLRLPPPSVETVDDIGASIGVAQSLDIAAALKAPILSPSHVAPTPSPIPVSGHKTRMLSPRFSRQSDHLDSALPPPHPPSPKRASTVLSVASADVVHISPPFPTAPAATSHTSALHDSEGDEDTLGMRSPPVLKKGHRNVKSYDYGTSPEPVIAVSKTVTPPRRSVGPRLPHKSAGRQSISPRPPASPRSQVHVTSALAGKRVFLCGNLRDFIGPLHIAKSLLSSANVVVATELTSDLFCVVTGAPETDNPLTDYTTRFVNQALQWGIPVVTWDWIESCMQANECLPMASHAIRDSSELPPYKPETTVRILNTPEESCVLQQQKSPQPGARSTVPQSPAPHEVNPRSGSSLVSGVGSTPTFSTDSHRLSSLSSAYSEDRSVVVIPESTLPAPVEVAVSSSRTGQTDALLAGFCVVLLTSTGMSSWSPSRDVAKADVVFAGGVVCEIVDAVQLATDGCVVAIAVSGNVHPVEYDIIRAKNIPIVSWGWFTESQAKGVLQPYEGYAVIRQTLEFPSDRLSVGLELEGPPLLHASTPQPPAYDPEPTPETLNVVISPTFAESVLRPPALLHQQVDAMIQRVKKMSTVSTITTASESNPIDITVPPPSSPKGGHMPSRSVKVISWCLSSLTASEIANESLVLARALSAVVATERPEIIAVQGLREHSTEDSYKTRFGALLCMSLNDIGIGSWHCDDTLPPNALFSPARSHRPAAFSMRGEVEDRNPSTTASGESPSDEDDFPTRFLFVWNTRTVEVTPGWEISALSKLPTHPRNCAILVDVGFKPDTLYDLSMMKDYFGKSVSRPFTKSPCLACFSLVGTSTRLLVVNCLWSQSGLHQVREWNNLARFLQTCNLSKQKRAAVIAVAGGFHTQSCRYYSSDTAIIDTSQFTRKLPRWQPGLTEADQSDCNVIASSNAIAVSGRAVSTTEWTLSASPDSDVTMLPAIVDIQLFP